MTSPRSRNPRQQATDLLPAGHVARVLEPSLPVNTDPDWFGDDPTDPSDEKRPVVTPIPGEGTTWGELVDMHPDLSEFVADNWLNGRNRLGPLPNGHDETRRSLHQLAFFAVAPARFAATGKLGLRYTVGGFGTPFFGNDEQIRVESGRLVHQVSDEVRSIRPKTLAEACQFLGIAYEETWFKDFHDPLAPIGPTAPLAIAETPSRAIGDWFGFATLALERTRRTPGAADVGRVQLWPEHFDPALEMGSHDSGHCASYGASPGDGDHTEPYLYVAAWGEVDRDDPYWNDPTFNGASLSYRQILDSNDQLQAALDFYQRGYQTLTDRKT